MYKCPNPDCGETWGMNNKEYLIPSCEFERGRTSEGWMMKAEKFQTDCPACADDWLWSDWKTSSGTHKALTKLKKGE
jgi:hypothetical protein